MSHGTSPTDALSRNALDDRPFATRPPSSTERIRRCGMFRKLTPDLMAGRALEDFADRDPFPLPSADDREGYHRGDDAAYWVSGLVDALKVRAVCRKHGHAPRSVLELGCASGRVLRHLLLQAGIPEVWGCDIDHRHVRWLQSHLPPQLRLFQNSVLPTLPLPDGSLDLVCAFSVFTHVDSFELGWLAELRRVMRDGALGYLTICDESSWRALRELPKDNMLVRALLLSGRFRIEDLDGEMPPGRSVYLFRKDGPYRANVFHSEAYVREQWGRLFRIVDVLPRHHEFQTVVVVRR